eukprot:scaffold121408_cov30-Tisochrysis_lutea.AAC.20
MTAQWHVATHRLGINTVPKCRSRRSLAASPFIRRDSRASVSRMLRCLSKHANLPKTMRPSVSPTRSGESSICRTSSMPARCVLPAPRRARFILYVAFRT